jgi:hypothetical protein
MATDQSIHIVALEPHMHRIGERMSTSVKLLDGSLEMIFENPFSFGSETHYSIQYELKPGEQLVTSCTFDNDNTPACPSGVDRFGDVLQRFRSQWLLIAPVRWRTRR